MRIGSNKLSELRSFFQRELAGQFPADEINAMFTLAAETYLGWTRSQVHARINEHINQSELLRLYDCAKALAKQVPLQYILGKAWFMDMRFLVNTSVLIPRPETEELVRLALDKFPSQQAAALDIGTGSGCIAIALKKKRPAWQVLACDISPDALQTATINAKVNDATIGFFRCDVLNEQIGGQFNLVISNPPYIAPSERAAMTRQVLDHEPTIALFGPDEDPVLFYKKIIELCRDHLCINGMLFFELNPATASQVFDYANDSGLFRQPALVSDMSGKIRFFYGTRK